MITRFNLTRSLSVLVLTIGLGCLSPNSHAEEVEEYIEVDLDKLTEAFEDQVEAVEETIAQTLEILEDRFEELIEELEDQDELDEDLVVEAVNIIELLEEIEKQFDDVNEEIE